jgi:hypothetical protein
MSKTETDQRLRLQVYDTFLVDLPSPRRLTARSHYIVAIPQELVNLIFANRNEKTWPFVLMSYQHLNHEHNKPGQNGQKAKGNG